jgi:OOP family OmpA-OmpF porin
MRVAFTRLLWAGVLLGCVAGPVSAQQTGAYAGGSIGMTSVDVCDGVGAFGVTDCDDQDIGFKIFGGFRLNENFAAEVGYVDLGEVSLAGPAGSGSIETDGFQFAGVGRLPINEQFDVFAKIGLYMWDLSASGPGGSADDDGTDIMFGFGGAWNFTEQLALRAEWERFDLDGDNVDLLSLGLQFNF